MKGPTTQQRLERKISFLCLLIHSCHPLFSFYSFYFFWLLSAFSHSHPPSAGIRSASYTDTPLKSLKLLSTLQKVSCHGNSLGFCHSVERLIKSRTNFHNVMKQTTTGQAFKKRWNFFQIYFNEKINLNLAKYIHTYFIVTSPKGLFRNNDYITLFIITNNKV